MKRTIISNEKFDKNFKTVIATHEVEGINFDDEQKNLLRDYFTGKIDRAEFDKKVIERIN